MRARLAALATLVVATSMFSQQQPPLVETIEVRVANVDVVVTDRKGNPIVGLTKDDFELYDERVKQPITNFYEVRRGEDMSAAGNQDVPVAVRQRRVAVFVDSATLTPSRKSAVLLSVQKFIDRMQPEDRVMLVNYRFGTQITTPFTNDKALLKKSLETIAHAGPAGPGSRTSEDLMKMQIQQMFTLAQESQSDLRPLITWQQAYDESRNIVTNHGNELFDEERQLLNMFDAVATTMGGLEGKKVLVFVAENLPENPAADMYRFVNNLFGPYLNRNAVLDFETSFGVPGNDIPHHIEQIARNASASGVTVYTIGAAASDSDFSSENHEAIDYSYTFARDANTASSLQTIAEVTGGVAITRTSNFELAFDTIHHDLSSYYSLGYKPVAEGIVQHKVDVKVKNPDYRVRARQSFIVKSSDEQMSDRTVANLYLPNGASEWPISVRIGKEMKSEGKDVLVPIQVVIPSTLTLLPQEDKLAGGLTMYFATGDAAGRTSTVIRVPESVVIPAAIEQTARAKPMLYQTSLRVRPGENLLSVAIVDQVSGTTGFARAKFVAR
jgi:VWFA-related protein